MKAEKRFDVQELQNCSFISKWFMGDRRFKLNALNINSSAKNLVFNPLSAYCPLMVKVTHT